MFRCVAQGGLWVDCTQIEVYSARGSVIIIIIMLLLLTLIVVAVVVVVYHSSGTFGTLFQTVL